MKKSRVKYTTISIRSDVKEILDKFRKNKDWSQFLLDLLNENQRLKRILAAKKMQERFNDRIEKAVLESVKKLRNELKFREIV